LWKYRQVAAVHCGTSAIPVVTRFSDPVPVAASAPFHDSAHAGTGIALSEPDRVPRSLRLAVPTHPCRISVLGRLIHEALEQRCLGSARTVGAFGGSRLCTGRRRKL